MVKTTKSDWIILRTCHSNWVYLVIYCVSARCVITEPEKEPGISGNGVSE